MRGSGCASGMPDRASATSCTSTSRFPSTGTRASSGCSSWCRPSRVSEGARAPRTPRRWPGKSAMSASSHRRVNHLEDFVDPLLDPGSLFAQVAELSESLHPLGLSGARAARVGLELFLQCLGYEFLKRLTALGRSRLGLAK